MIVSFGIAGAFFPGSESELNADCLHDLMDCLVNLNRAYLRSMARQGRTVPFIYNSGIVYGRTLSWDTIPRSASFGTWRLQEPERDVFAPRLLKLGMRVNLSFGGM